MSNIFNSGFDLNITVHWTDMCWRLMWPRLTIKLNVDFLFSWMFSKDKSLVIFHLEAGYAVGVVKSSCWKTLKLYLDKRRKCQQTFQCQNILRFWVNKLCGYSLISSYYLFLCLWNNIYINNTFLFILTRMTCLWFQTNLIA